MRRSSLADAILRGRSRRHLADGPGLAAEAPVLRVVALDDDPGVVPEAGVRRLAQRVCELLDERRARLLVQAVVEQLDPDQRHRVSFSWLGCIAWRCDSSTAGSSSRT